MQHTKAQLPISVTPFGMFIDVRLLQSWKTSLSIWVTLSGISRETRLSQPENAAKSILSTLLGNFTDLNELHPSFVAHIDSQPVARNTVEKSYRGCFEDVKSWRFNNFNFILRQHEKFKIDFQ